MSNEAGSIHEVVDVLITYHNHSERILLAVTHLGKQSMILGFTWLDKHNPEIDFRAQTVKMTWCLPCCCSGCQAERKEEWNATREGIWRINACRTGPFPAFVEDADKDNDEPAAEPVHPPETEPDMFPDEPLEEGDRTLPAGGTHPSDLHSFPTPCGRLPTELYADEP